MSEVASQIADQLKQAFSSYYHKFAWYEGGSLFDVVGALLPQIPLSSWPDRAAFGGLYVNGIGSHVDMQLPNPACIEYYEPKFDFKTADQFYPPFKKEWILFEDEYLICCHKPSRLPTMPAKEQQQFSLRKYLDQYVGNAVHCPSRLDMSTQGLVIVSKRTESHGLLQQLFEKKQIQKYYLFLTSKIPEWKSYKVDAPIGKSNKHPVLREVHGAEAKNATTSLTLLKSHTFTSSNNEIFSGAFIQAKPITGRTHQIRVHAASLDLPIVGDKFYGHVPFEMLCLLSYQLEFIHPIYETPIRITVPQHLAPEWAKPALLSDPLAP